MSGKRVLTYDRKRQDRDLDDNTPSRFAGGAAIPMAVGTAAKEVRASAVAAMATAVAIKPAG